MNPAHQPSTPARQDKATLQREYREKEQECFAILRDVIKDLTGEELRTRQEILRKATEVLSSELRSQEEPQVSALSAYEAHSGPATNYVHDSTHHAMGNPVQLADWYPPEDFAMFNDGPHIHDDNIPDMAWFNHQQ